MSAPKLLNSQTQNMKIFLYPKETWDKEDCERRSKHRRKNAFGDSGPAGLIASNASSYPEYGQTIRFNGGCFINGENYDAQSRPLPDIHPDYEFYSMTGWGTGIRKKKID
jgi:hypothetical protein